jgi:Leucine-rich repeat (LRR) protein
MEFDGRLHFHAFEISSSDLHQLSDLRILRLTHFVQLKKLSENLGELVNGLQELTFSYCTCVEELPRSISKLQSLRVITMKYCSNLRQLPEDFGSLISLQELNLQGCKNLKALPNNFEKLTTLKLLDLSFCERLRDLPRGLGNLTSLVELDLKQCSQLRSIPESIGQMKSLPLAINMSGCSSLKELPNGLCSLSFITNLSLAKCNNLEKLPERFGELVNLRNLDLSDCINLEDLCNNFHCLDSLAILFLDGCHSLKRLPEYFHYLASLRQLYLSGCPVLEGKQMDNVVKIKTLQCVRIDQSEMLLKRWGEIQREGNPLWSFVVFTGQDLSEDLKAIIEKNVLSEFDCLLNNRQGEPFHLSNHLCADSLFLVFFDDTKDFDHDFPWPLFEETIDEIETKFEMIYIGDNLHKVPWKVKAKIVGYRNWDVRATGVLTKLISMLDVTDQEQQNATSNFYFQMRAKRAGDEKGADYRPCWKLLSTVREVEEFMLGKCRRYHRLKQLEIKSGGIHVG